MEMALRAKGGARCAVQIFSFSFEAPENSKVPLSSSFYVSSNDLRDTNHKDSETTESDDVLVSFIALTMFLAYR